MNPLLLEWWNVTADLYAFFGFSALLGIIMYYWAKATDQINRGKWMKMFESLGIEDIE